ncbi:MAG: YidC/Oxa1 family membrane protein insertase, partial [Clostridiales bacterium]|nr:YidC/Oxa1 family membrane protein insertase [Clostridiales bacterium]
VKLVLLPLTLKQYKSTSEMQAIQPLIQDIQKRYKNDKEKMNEEMMKIYSEHKVNPAGGCLPLLIQMPIILALYWVIVEPLKFMLNKSADQINLIVDVASKALNQTFNTTQRELSALNYFNEHLDALSQVSGALKQSELINFNFLGMKLGYTASYHIGDLTSKPGIYIPLLILTIAAVITTYFATAMAMPKIDKSKPASTDNSMAMANSMSNSMKYMGPIMTLMFSFTLPAGVVLYWMAGYVFQIGQQAYVNKFILKKSKQKAEEIAAQMAAKKAEQEMLIEEKKKAIAEAKGTDNKDGKRANTSSQSGEKAVTKPSQTGQKDKYSEKKKGGGKSK